MDSDTGGNMASEQKNNEAQEREEARRKVLEAERRHEIGLEKARKKLQRLNK